MEPDYASLQRALTVILNLALALLVGGSAAILWLRSGSSPWAITQLSRMRKLLLAATAATAAALVAILWVEAASMAEVALADALPAVRSMLTATHYGFAWMIGACALIVTGGSALAGPRLQAGGAESPIRVAAIGVLLYSRSMVSHAGADGDFTWAVATDWIHLALVSLWVGAVIVAGWLMPRQAPADVRPPDPQDNADRARYIEALSRSATIALAGIVLTGAIAAWRLLEGPANLTGNPYGTTLLVKLGFVLCAAALGALNRFFVMPRLLRALRHPVQAARHESRRFTRILRIEALVLATALVAAAFLTSTAPPVAH